MRSISSPSLPPQQYDKRFNKYVTEDDETSTYTHDSSVFDKHSQISSMSDKQAHQFRPTTVTNAPGPHTHVGKSRPARHYSSSNDVLGKDAGNNYALGRRPSLGRRRSNERKTSYRDSHRCSSNNEVLDSDVNDSYSLEKDLGLRRQHNKERKTSFYRDSRNTDVLDSDVNSYSAGKHRSLRRQRSKERRMSHNTMGTSDDKTGHDNMGYKHETTL